MIPHGHQDLRDVAREREFTGKRKNPYILFPHVQQVPGIGVILLYLLFYDGSCEVIKILHDDALLQYGSSCVQTSVSGRSRREFRRCRSSSSVIGPCLLIPSIE